MRSHRDFNEQKPYTLGEILGGHTLRSSGHNVHFPPHVEETNEECTTPPLTEEQANAFAKAAQDQWFYQMYLDDLPVWGMVGEVLPQWDSKEAQEEFEKKLRHGESDYTALEEAIQGRHTIEGATLYPFVYTERELTIQYNNDQIIQVDLVSFPQSLEKVQPGQTYTFKLNVVWKPTTDLFHSRFERYLDHEFFKHQIHWFSIFNSFMMVIFLSSLVSIIMIRTLKRDYARYANHYQNSNIEEGNLSDADDSDSEKKQLKESSANLTEESGWKQVHGDVFRAPPYLPLFAAIIGIGWQIVALISSVLLFAALGKLHGDVYEERGEMLHAFMYCYCLSSIVAGYASGSYFKRYYNTTSKTSTSFTQGSQAWQGVLLLTIIILPTIVTTIIAVLHAISMYYGTISSITFIVIFKLFSLWVFISVPLTVLGTLIGRHRPSTSKENFPCRVNSIPRPIPDDVPWHGQPMYLIPLSGLLPFGSIFIELYYVLTSLWNYKYYHVYGFLLAMYMILAIVVSLTTIISIYFCLNAENYHWQWTSFATGASTSVYVFLYSVYYFFFRTSMHGLLQTAFYFGYTFLLTLSIGLLCGTLGHNASSQFVKRIFGNVKVD